MPEPTLSRLTLYLRCLRQLARDGVKTISSAEMETHCGFMAVQIRKDLSHFGEFGKPGIGYDVKHLLERLTQIMHLDREHRVVIVGAGSLGSAVSGYSGFAGTPFQIVGIFDNNYAKIGRMLWDLEIKDVRDLPAMNKELRANIGVIAVPAEAAQEAADTIMKAGIRAILNFAPTFVTVPPEVALRNVDLTRQLEILSFHLPRLPSPPEETPAAADT